MLMAHTLQTILEMLTDIEVDHPPQRHRTRVIARWLLEASVSDVAVEAIRMREAA